MNENLLPDYLDHIQQAAIDACSFVEGMAKDEFLVDKRTQQAVIRGVSYIGPAMLALARLADERQSFASWYIYSWQ